MNDNIMLRNFGSSLDKLVHACLAEAGYSGDIPEGIEDLRDQLEEALATFCEQRQGQQQ